MQKTLWCVITVTTEVLMLHFIRAVHYKIETNFLSVKSKFNTLFSFSLNIMGRPTYDRDVQRNAHTLNPPSYLI